MIEVSNQSNEEFYRLNGSLTPARIEALLDVEWDEEMKGGVLAHLSEVGGGLYSEDFMSPIQDDLRSLRNNLRGANREEMNRILGVIEDFAQTSFYAGDYARSELKGAIAILEGKE